MSLPDRDNPYSFDAFLEQLKAFDFYADDPFLQKVVRHYSGSEWPELNEKLLAMSSKASFRWRDLADHVARPDLRPYLEHYDAHRHRIDRIVFPLEAKILQEEIFGEALYSAKTSLWESFTKRFLVDQVGTTGVSCPLACTEGLIALIEKFPDQRHPELDTILQHCKEGIDGEFGVGAQFMSEAQGGSDIPSNLIEAVPDGDHYRVYGNKFFCSAIHSDYSVLTAKVTGSEDVGTFVVPAWLPGNKEKEIRNGYRINRIKWKMGTVEVPTAEVDYDGAIAYAVGPTNRGVANAVGIVLALSRITVGRTSGAGMLRAAREAMLYSEFRDVFGSKIAQYPLAAGQVRGLIDAAQRTTAGAFKIYDLYVRLGAKLQPGLASDEPLEQQKLRFNLRELVIMQKLTTAYETVDVIRKAISTFGGHGVIEDFSSLPRFFRDSTVNELWEGPKNVLLMQVFRDILRVRDWYDPREFVENLLDGTSQDMVNDLANTLNSFLDDPPFLRMDPDSMDRAAQWETFCDTFLRTYQELALKEVGKAPIVSEERMSLPSVWA